MSTTTFSQFNSVVGKKLCGADVEALAPIVAKWEGGYVNDPIDRGGATNMGITLTTWIHLGYDKDGDGDIDKDDVRLLSTKDFAVILRKYWDKWRADEIRNQSIANILVDWYWGSGKWGIVIPQRDILKFDPKDCDGIVGPQTLKALNALIEKDAIGLFNKIYAAREKFLDGIVSSSIVRYEKKLGRRATAFELKNYTQQKYIKGWKNRLADFKFSN